MAKAVAWLEKETGKKFGDPKNPLLVSVRSGARDSMPGMMDTILNLGLNDTTVEGLKAATNNGRFAWDSYRRFVQMYGDVVMGVQKRHENEHEPFDEVMDQLKHEARREGRHRPERSRSARAGQALQDADQGAHRQGISQPIRSSSLQGAIGAVFSSWMNERAILYRQKYRIPDEWGTAVNVQSMVFGNMGDDCATGVAFTRDPATGENVFYGEYLVNAQGEDVVAGVRTPKQVAEMANDPIIGPAYKELEKVRKTLEKNFGDVQDFEFTIEKKKLYMLQTRNGKRTALAYVKIAHDMVKEGLMTPEHAIRSGDPEALNQLLQPIFDRARLRAGQEGRPTDGHGLAGRPRRGLGQSGVQRQPRPKSWADQGRESRAGPHRNQPGRSARHDRLRRHSHLPRRRFQPRGPGRPADGQGLRRRRRRYSHRLPHRHAHLQRRDAARRRCRSASTARPAKCSTARSTPPTAN